MKKWFSLLFAVLLAVSLAACSSETPAGVSDSTTDAPSDSIASEATSTEAPVPETSDDDTTGGTLIAYFS